MQVLVTDPLEGALTSLWNVSAFVETTVADVLRSDRRAIDDVNNNNNNDDRHRHNDNARNVDDNVDDDDSDDE